MRTRKEIEEEVNGYFSVPVKEMLKPQTSTEKSLLTLQLLARIQIELLLDIRDGRKP